jgi:ABC-type uncharacterized transport system involved in gliding motility auxiliary subunit
LLQTVSDAERLSEVKLTNGIEQVTSDRTDTVYFLQGHGERPLEQVEGGLSQAVSALNEKNFNAQPLNLAERSEVPEDASIVVVAGPKRALFEGEAQALRNYLSSGGSLLLMVDPEANPGLDSLLADWGVKLDRQIAIDASGQGRSVGLGPATPLVSNYGNHPITKDFGSGFSVYPLARPVETKSVEGVTQTPIVRTTDQSWGESTPEKQPFQFDPKSDRSGPLTLGVALTRKIQPTSALPTPKVQPQTSPQASPSPTTQASATPQASPTPTTQASATPQASPSPTTQQVLRLRHHQHQQLRQVLRLRHHQRQQLRQVLRLRHHQHQQLRQVLRLRHHQHQQLRQVLRLRHHQPPTTQTRCYALRASPTPTTQAGATPQASPTPTTQAGATPQASPTPSVTGQPQASPSSENKAKPDEKTAEARLVVYGNSNFATDGWFQQQLNSDVFLNSVSWLSKRDEQALSIRPKESKNRRINLSLVQTGILGWTALVIMPLLGFTTAGVMWWRRR